MTGGNGKPAQERVLHALLERQAKKYDRRPFLYFEDKVFSFADVNNAANRVAAGLQKLGVKKGDKVAVLMENYPEGIFLVYGLSKLGAVEVPLNTAHRGDMLQYMLDQSDSTVIFLGRSFIERLEFVLDRLPKIRHIIIFDDSEAPAGQPPGSGGLFAGYNKDVMEWENFYNNDGGYLPADVFWSDPILIMYTSGTTGPSKGVLIPHNLMYCEAERKRDWALGSITEDDCFYNIMPHFHMAGWHGCINPALLSGARTVLIKRFSASVFWDDIRRYGCTYSIYIGAIASILYKAEPKPNDNDNPLKAMVGSPCPVEIYEDFQKRFGIRLVEFYGSTEIAAPLVNRIDSPYKVGSCGMVHPDYDIRLVNDDNIEVGSNEVGEIIARPMKPYAIMLGYYKMPEQTMEAWQNLWFHTGDYAYHDEDGYYFFSDRKKDALRRRGENVSSYELEKIISSHPDVLESAVIGVESDLSEQEIMVCLAMAPGKELSYEDLMGYCEKRMAYFMVPRYVRYMETLPKNASLRVEKYKLRQDGITADTWDREKAGYKLQR